MTPNFTNQVANKRELYFNQITKLPLVQALWSKNHEVIYFLNYLPLNESIKVFFSLLSLSDQTDHHFFFYQSPWKKTISMK